MRIPSGWRGPAGISSWAESASSIMSNCAALAWACLVGALARRVVGRPARAGPCAVRRPASAGNASAPLHPDRDVESVAAVGAKNHGARMCQAEVTTLTWRTPPRASSNGSERVAFLGRVAAGHHRAGTGLPDSRPRQRICSALREPAGRRVAREQDGPRGRPAYQLLGALLAFSSDSCEIRCSVLRPGQRWPSTIATWSPARLAAPGTREARRRVAEHREAGVGAQERCRCGWVRRSDQGRVHAVGVLGTGGEQQELTAPQQPRKVAVQAFAGVEPSTARSAGPRAAAATASRPRAGGTGRRAAAVARAAGCPSARRRGARPCAASAHTTGAVVIGGALPAPRRRSGSCGSHRRLAGAWPRRPEARRADRTRRAHRVARNPTMSR
jgi:hypothetical protein